MYEYHESTQSSMKYCLIFYKFYVKSMLVCTPIVTTKFNSLYVRIFAYHYDFS